MNAGYLSIVNIFEGSRYIKNFKRESIKDIDFFGLSDFSHALKKEKQVEHMFNVLINQIICCFELNVILFI